MSKWKYYHHALVTTCQPHEKMDMTNLISGEVWKEEGKRALLARWTSNYDCGKETEWWYCIKDTPEDISLLSAKKRYIVNKGMKCFDVHVIDSSTHCEEMLNIRKTSYKERQRAMRPSKEKNEIEGIRRWSSRPGVIIYGAFLKDSSTLCGYASIIVDGRCVYLNTQCVIPEYEKMQINAALVHQICTDYSDRIVNEKMYICDGQRNIQHQTQFQSYLIKYFGFRNAYCRLNIAYRPGWYPIIQVLYVFRHIFSTNMRLGSRIKGVLLMEEIRRSFD